MKLILKNRNDKYCNVVSSFFYMECNFTIKPHLNLLVTQRVKEKYKCAINEIKNITIVIIMNIFIFFFSKQKNLSIQVFIKIHNFQDIA